MSGPSGILLIDKPAGWTSHDVVAKARGITRQRKIGHTGTLDPMATGLLVLCLGGATRLVEYMTLHSKRYVGEVVLGVTTETDDAEGAVVERRAVPEITEERLRVLEAEFSGAIMQVPPAFSAVKVAGQRAYAAARAGSALELAARPVTVHSLELTKEGDDRLRVEAWCGSGTYVRSLARDIGAALGCGGHLGALRRTETGGFRVEDALTLEDLEVVCATGMLEEFLMAQDEGVREYGAVVLTDGQARVVRQGGVVVTDAEGRTEPVRVYSGEGAFVGVGRVDEEGGVRPLKVLEGR